MDAKVIVPFFDKENPDDVYQVGDTFTGTTERIKGLIARGFVEEIKEEKPKRTPRKKAAAKE